jgi:thiol-disulfide isomerase/thioredoxin
MKKQKSVKRNVIEWSILILVPLLLYLTGLHTSVLGAIQRMVISSGIRNAESQFADADLGEASYNFTLENFDGSVLRGEELKGKTVFLNLWASWCPPCRAEMPNIEGLYNNINDNNIVFIFLSFDDDLKKSKEYISSFDFNDDAYFLRTSLPSAYASNTIPTTFVISPDGRIKLKEAGMAYYNTDDFISELTSLSGQPK